MAWLLTLYSYFINDIDEVRSKQNPRAWFHYFLTKNSRYNDVQREAMNGEKPNPHTPESS